MRAKGIGIATAALIALTAASRDACRGGADPDRPEAPDGAIFITSIPTGAGQRRRQPRRDRRAHRRTKRPTRIAQALAAGDRRISQAAGPESRRWLFRHVGDLLPNSRD
jgi:hypothetical protein